MKVFICTGHSYVNPVGTASVVVAETIELAYIQLDIALEAQGLDNHHDHPYVLRELCTNTPQALILCNGDY